MEGLNEVVTIKEILTKYVGEYVVTTPPSVNVDFSSLDGSVPLNFVANIQYGFSTLDIEWIFSALLLILAFVGFLSIVRSVLSSILR